MIPIKQKITRKGTGFDSKTWRSLLKDAWESSGELWHKELLPKHFTVDAKSEYGYRPRTKKWNERKQREVGHTKPLVFTGDLQRMVARIRDIKPSAKGANVRLHGPKYLFAFRKKSNAADLARELQAVSGKDASILAKHIDSSLERAVKSNKLAKTQTIQVGSGHTAVA